MRNYLKGLRCRLVCLVLLAAIMSAGLAGCAGSKINQENFDKIRIGMTQEEVQHLLGPATEASGVELPIFAGTMSKWVAGDTTITITFVNGKVIAKEFSKAPKK